MLWTRLWWIWLHRDTEMKCCDGQRLQGSHGPCTVENTAENIPIPTPTLQGQRIHLPEGPQQRNDFYSHLQMMSFRPSVIRLLSSRLSNDNNYHNSQLFYLQKKTPTTNTGISTRLSQKFCRAACEEWTGISKSDTERNNIYSML